MLLSTIFGVLQELIQNADDAGASEVKFLLDNSHYPTNHLFSPAMRQYQVSSPQEGTLL
jgi:sacsin